MTLIVTILGAVLAVFIVIVLHEAGHFFVAKALGVRVLRFSIGFGKALWSCHDRSGTEYVIAILPLGGYVKMLDDREMQVSSRESKRAYNRQPLLSRIAIVLAGPLANFLLAILVFWGVFLLGVSYVKPVIGEVLPGSIADRAGLKSGEVIQAVNRHPTHGWQAVLTAMVERVGSPRPVAIRVESSDHSLQTHDLSLQDWKLAGKEPDVLGSLGITPFQPLFLAVIEKVMPHSPAEQNGLEPGDRIEGFKDQPPMDWPALAKKIQDMPNQKVILTIARGQSKSDVTLQLGAQSEQNHETGYLGVEVKPPVWPKEMIVTTHYSLLSAWEPAWMETWNLTRFNAIVLAKMVKGKISLATLGGPITIFRSAGAASQAGLRVYLSFIAFISVTLGFINILPIPGLDGGHFLFHVIESIIRRPISEKYQALLVKIGIVVILLLIIQGTINDIVRLF